jgi:hypothetical protein
MSGENNPHLGHFIDCSTLQRKGTVIFAGTATLRIISFAGRQLPAEYV